MTTSPIGKGVRFGRVIFADFTDMAPAVLTTWLLSTTGTAGLGVAFGAGFVVWLLSPVLCRSTAGTSFGGLATELRWVTRDRKVPSFAAAIKHTLFSQAYACLALGAWVMFAIIAPWRLFVPATYKAFDTPNTELFGILVDRQHR